MENDAIYWIVTWCFWVICGASWFAAIVLYIKAGALRESRMADEPEVPFRLEAIKEDKDERIRESEIPHEWIAYDRNPNVVSARILRRYRDRRSFRLFMWARPPPI